MPMPYSSDVVVLHSEEALDEEGKPRKHHGDDHEHHPHHHGRHGHHGHHGLHGHHHKSFLKRIHRAIKALGPWEGRAVSFVLGKKSEILSFPGLIYCMSRLWYRRSSENVLGYVSSCLSHRTR